MFYLIAGAVAAYAVYQTFFADNSDDRGHSKPKPPPSYEPTQPHVRRRDECLPTTRFSYEPAQPPVPQRDDRQRPTTIVSSQRDEAVPSLETYASLRAKAKQEGDLMSKCYEKSKAAYDRHDRALAKTLSDKGKYHKGKMEDLNAKASAIVFKGEAPSYHSCVTPLTVFSENNQGKEADEVDLHGLHVKEAIAYAKKALAQARQKGFPEIRFIVGQGNHSDGGVARIKPAIQDAMQE
ncbi:hypothetical protein JVU11DRAFT_2700 [Chiua virens]|nr:hypothetical protein JVU11DRAFT_2700 [Chiua virens]